MGLFDFLFKTKPKPKGEYHGEFKMLDGYSPHFSRFGGNIYASEVVRAAIHACAGNIAKLKIDVQGSAKRALQNKLRHGPNQVQTWSQFLYRVATILYVHNTAFIVPVYDPFGEISGIYSVLPSRCELVEYGTSADDAVPYLRYTFSNGQKAAIELEYCGILTRYQYKHDLFGETNEALLPTMELIHIQKQGISEGVKNSASYRFMAQLNNFADDEDIVNERKRFSEENFSKDARGGGLLLFPNIYSNIKQLEQKPYAIDAEQMKIIRASVFDYFGVNEDVVQNKAFGDAWAAFYEGVVEPFAIQFSEVMTRMLFTFREQSEGNLVMATANRLQYMTNKDKLEVSAAMADRGIMNRDEIREIWNLPPLPNGEGQIYTIRGEYVNAADRVTSGTETE